MSAPEQVPETPHADHDLIRAALAPYEGLAGQVGIWILHEVGGRSESHRYGTSSAELDRAARDTIKADAVDEPVGIYLRGTTVDPEAGGRGGADDSVTWIHIRADLDLGKPHGPRNWRELFDAFSRARLPEPTDWQHSGGGFYPRWQLATPVADSAEIRLVAKRIERELVTAWREAGFTQGVDACADAARVWRMAGTVHRKDREHPVSSTTGKSSGRVYTPAELVADLPEPAPERVAATGPGAGGAEHERRTYTPGQAERVLARALARVRESVYPGNVNTTLNESAMTIGHLAAEYLGWDADDALERACALIEPALLAGPGRRAGWTGLDRTDRGTIRSGLSAGMARPDRIVAAPVMPLLVADGPCEEGYVLDGLTEHWDGHGPTARLRTGEDPALATDDAAAVSAAYEHDQAAERALTVELGSAAEARALLTERRRREAREALDAEARPALRPLEEVVVWGDEMDQVPPPSFAIEELIPDRAVGWLGGPSGSYKSFVAVQLMLGLCRGVAPLEHGEFAVTRRQKVLYIAAEGSAGVFLRARAALARLDLKGTREHVVWSEAVDFTDERALARVIAFAREHEFGFIIADTWRQVTPGVDEIDNTDVSLILRKLLMLRDTDGIGSLLLDHTNKSARGLADLGGAGAKRANADYVLMIDLPNGDRGRGEQRTLRVAKLKDWEDGRTWPIRLESVDEVTDDKGRPSAVALVGEIEPGAADIHGDDDWRDVDLPEDVRAYSGAGRESLSLVTQLVVRYGSGESGVSRSEVVGYYRAALPEVSKNAAQKRVGKAWDALHELGRLDPVGSGASRVTHHRWVTKE